MMLKEPEFFVKLKIDYKFMLINGVLGRRMLAINRKYDLVFKLMPYLKIPLSYLGHCM